MLIRTAEDAYIKNSWSIIYTFEKTWREDQNNKSFS